MLGDFIKLFGAMITGSVALYVILSEGAPTIESGRLTGKGKKLSVLAVLGLLASVLTVIYEGVEKYLSEKQFESRHEQVVINLEALEARMENSLKESTHIQSLAVVVVFSDANFDESSNEEDFILRATFSYLGNHGLCSLKTYPGKLGDVESVSGGCCSAGPHLASRLICDYVGDVQGRALLDCSFVCLSGIYRDVDLPKVSGQAAVAYITPRKYSEQVPETVKKNERDWPFPTMQQLKNVSFDANVGGTEKNNVQAIYVVVNGHYFAKIPRANSHVEEKLRWRTKSIFHSLRYVGNFSGFFQELYYDWGVDAY